MAKIRRWDGKKWVDGNRFVKRWDGKKWVNAVVKMWDGKKWAIISEERRQTTWEATWTRSYGGASTQKPAWLGGLSLMHQGRYGAPDSLQYDWGIQKSMAGFNWQSIQAELKDSRIEKVELYLHNQHFWYYAGGRAHIGYHNASSPPSRFSKTAYGVRDIYYPGRGNAKWIEMPKDFGEQLKKGKAKGFTLFRNSTELSYYGYWYGAGSGWRTPKIRITYYK